MPSRAQFHDFSLLQLHSMSSNNKSTFQVGIWNDFLPRTNFNKSKDFPVCSKDLFNGSTMVDRGRSVFLLVQLFSFHNASDTLTKCEANAVSKINISNPLWYVGIGMQFRYYINTVGSHTSYCRSNFTKNWWDRYLEKVGQEFAASVQIFKRLF